MQSLSFSLCVYAHGGFQVEGKDGIQFESLKRSQSAQTTLLSSLWGWGFFRGDWDLKRTVGDIYRLLETAGVGCLIYIVNWGSTLNKQRNIYRDLSKSTALLSPHPFPRVRVPYICRMKPQNLKGLQEKLSFGCPFCQVVESGIRVQWSQEQEPKINR